VVVDRGIGKLLLGNGFFEDCVGLLGGVWKAVFVVLFKGGSCRCVLESIASSSIKKGLS
jgi:hypothetical protein